MTISGICSKTWLLIPALFLCTLSFIPSPASATSFSVVYPFAGASDGAYPNAGLSMDSSGNFYGTTRGTTGGVGQGNGTVFMLSPSGSGWTLTTLYEFAGGMDGSQPFSRVLIGPDGSLYGVTLQGGSGCGLIGCGTVYKLTHSGSGWTKTTLYQFAGSTDGAQPTDDLIMDSAGALYGTASAGGVPHSCGGLGCGVVYKLTPSGSGWTETPLYQFKFSASDHNDGLSPTGGVIFDPSGNLYGVTYGGGLNLFGTVFELTPSGSGWTEKVLYTFQDGSDGKLPGTGVIFDTSGNLYGTTSMGGMNGGGVVFELVPSGGNWTMNVLYSFFGGLGPSHGNLLVDAGGNLYGTTAEDGSQLQGSAYLLTPSVGSWTYTSLHDFTGGSDGSQPESNLIFDSNGHLLGTTLAGGANGYGVVFQITPPPVAPVITQQPQDQSVTVGNIATFQVIAAGTPPLIYRWFKNAIAIPGANGASYTTPPTQLSDNGEQFYVTVNNITNMPVTSHTVTLTVNNLQTVATPTIAPNGGTFTNPITVTLSDTTSGARLYYTTDGSYPTQNSTLYVNPFVLDASALVSVVGFESGMNPSAEAQAQFTVTQEQTVDTPSISPNGGTFTNSVTVTLGDTTSGAQIYYTTDGSVPTQGYTLYSAPFVLTKNATVSAIGFENMLNPSNEVQAKFTVTTSSGGGKTSGGGSLDWFSLIMLLGLIGYARWWLKPVSS